MEISEDQNTITTDDGVIHTKINCYGDGSFGAPCDLCSLCEYGRCNKIPCTPTKRHDGIFVHFVTINEVNND